MASGVYRPGCITDASSSDRRTAFRRSLDVLVVVGSVAATLIFLGVVIAAASEANHGLKGMVNFWKLYGYPMVWATGVVSIVVVLSWLTALIGFRRHDRHD